MDIVATSIDEGLLTHPHKTMVKAVLEIHMNDKYRQNLARLSAIVAQDEINTLVNPKKAVREARDRVTKLMKVLNNVEIALRDDTYIRAMIAPQSPVSYEDMCGKERIRIEKALEAIDNWYL